MTPGPATSERAEIVVDLAAVRHNVGVLRRTAGVPLMAVVKADAYGHGLVPVARAAREAGAEWVATATPEEALAVREAGDTGPLLCWLTVPGDDLAPAVARGIDVGAYSTAELDALEEAVHRVRHRPGGEATARARVHLKVDTGMTRGGASEADWPALWDRALAGERAGVWDVVGLWSHLACADEPEHPANDAQQAAFERATASAARAGLRPPLRHLANSAATLLRPGVRYDAVRCGIAMYGLDPAPDATPDGAHAAQLVPAMTVRTRLAMTKHAAPGDAVSYGHTWSAEGPTTLGLLPVGYGDGVPRQAGTPEPVVEVAVAGRRAPVRGRVCMDQLLVDLGPDEAVPAAAGDPVELFGPPGDGRPSATDWARACGTISYEIVTRIGGRMHRRYVDSAPVAAADQAADQATARATDQATDQGEAR